MQYFIHNTSEFESILRFIFFIFGLLLFTSMGLVFRYRNKFEGHTLRTINNLVLGALNVFLLKLLIPVSLSVLALKAEQQGYGLFNILRPTLNWIVTYNVLVFILALLIMDLILYLQHILTHRVPWLWKLHRVHHTDIGFDTTTALRFHPLEILFSLIVKVFSIFVFGISVEAIITFEIILNLSALFNHSNFTFPSIVEKWIRVFIVTPGMHRIHHSKYSLETNSNFGFCLSIWDKIFNTYRSSPKDNPETMDIGIETYRKLKDQNIFKLLIQPFTK